MSSVRVNEYYDVFNVALSAINTNVNVGTSTFTESLPNEIVEDGSTNTFRGFSNWLTDFNSQNPNNNVVIAGKHKAQQGINNINIDENGNIYCCPPNVTVPYWSRIIFRNYDYLVQPSESTRYDSILNTYCNKIETLQSPPYYFDNNSNYVPIPEYTPDLTTGDPVKLWNKNATAADVLDNYKKDWSDFTGFEQSIKFVDYSKVPLFLKFDQYPSRSKVIFSQCDKTRNPDIEFVFGYQHGQMEPIKLNLSLSAGNPIVDNTNKIGYNLNLKREDIEKILKKCYWCIEWIYDRVNGN